MSETITADEFNALPERKKRGNKYGAVKAERILADGSTHVFDSKAEANRYDELMLMERAGMIRYPVMQPRWSLDINGVHICNYTADFMYWENGEQIVEDVKGVKTRDYRIRKKLMLAVYGIAIRETGK